MVVLVVVIFYIGCRFDGCGGGGGGLVADFVSSVFSFLFSFFFFGHGLGLPK